MTYFAGSKEVASADDVGDFLIYVSLYTVPDLRRSDAIGESTQRYMCSNAKKSAHVSTRTLILLEM